MSSNISTILNKLLKGDLEKICKDANVAIPASASTKKAIVDFMISYDKWPTPLEQILSTMTGTPKPSKKTTTSKAAQIGATVTSPPIASIDPGVIEAIKKSIQELDTKLSSLNYRIDGLDGIIKKIQISSASNVKSNASSNDAKTLREIDMKVVEAITEEWVPLDDVKSFLDDVDDKQFKESVRYMLAMGAIEGKDGEGDLQVELVDGTMIGEVKKR